MLPKGFLGILTIVVMVCGPSMVGMMLTICLPILPNMVAAVAGNKAALIAMPTGGIVVGGIIAGFLLSRVPARTLMLTAIALFGIIGALGFVLQGWPLLTSRFLIGVVSTWVSASSTTLIGEHIPLRIRSLVLGCQMAGSSLVGIVAMNASARPERCLWLACLLRAVPADRAHPAGPRRVPDPGLAARRARRPAPSGSAGPAGS